MHFGAFLDALESGEQGLYLTTQDVPDPPQPQGEESATAAPFLGGALAARLVEDASLRPPLLSGLVPALLNVWMGHSKAGTSSGLHHDFHDNLYVLMRGRKRFRLWPPKAWPALRPAGRVRTLHSSGLFEYEGGGGPRRPDGAPLGAFGEQKYGLAELSPTCCRLCAERLERRERSLRRRVAETEFNAAQSEADDADGRQPDGGERLKAAEQELDAAMEAELDLLCHGNGDDEDDDEIGSDDYKDEDDYEDEDEDGDEDGDEDEDGDGDEDEDEDEDGVGGNDAGEPLLHHFSTLSSVGDAVKGAGPPLEVELQAGEMLFLPCGWFHEVTSLSAGPEGHLAFNYWFWPPDGSSAERPYTSPFWETDFRARRAGGRLFHAA
jgi:hypothetical protein